MTIETCMVVTPWHDREQLSRFLEAWNVEGDESWLVLQHDKNADGCGVTKNKGIAEAMRRGAKTVVVLDDDCFPTSETTTLVSLMCSHCDVLETPAGVKMFEPVTYPPSRGTPYYGFELKMPVAASMGFWNDIGDYDAVRQLAFSEGEMRFKRQAIFGRYFPLCGMNLAFRPHDWLPWCKFIDVPRFDDIWMGWLWQREAYSRGYCFSLTGPAVTHSRQSNVWRNLQLEAVHLEANDNLWQTIATLPYEEYDDLFKLLPHHVRSV